LSDVATAQFPLPQQPNSITGHWLVLNQTTETSAQILITCPGCFSKVQKLEFQHATN